MEKTKNNIKEISSETFSKNKESLSQLTEMIIEMAKETENKDLNKQLIESSVNYLVNNPKYGQYNVICNEDNNLIQAMNMITYEFDVQLCKKIIWLQSVFVRKENRRQGLFKNLLNFNENLTKSESFEKVIRLYMDKENLTAEATYLNLGFKKLEHLKIYEFDYYFNENNDLLNDNFDNFDQKICYSEDFKEHEQKIEETNFVSLNFNSDHPIQNDLKGINECLSNVEGKVLIILNEQKEILGLVYIFFEYSDWRNSFFWWISEIKLNSTLFERFYKNSTQIINSLILFNKNYGNTCGIRCICTEKSEDVFKNSFLSESHYFIFEKKIE